MTSLYPDGAPPALDPVRAVGAAIGAIARIVQQASRDVVTAVRDAVARAALPTPEEIRTNGSGLAGRISRE
jgi:hypothetical protein